MGRTLQTAAWVAVLVVAAGLRAWNLAWGLDIPTWFPDEMFWFKRMGRFIPLSWASFEVDTLVYPTLYGYVAGLATSATAGLVGLEPIVKRALNPSMLLVARATSVAAGIVTVAVTGAIGRRLYGPRVGLAAAALLAVVPLEAVQTHYASVDVMLGTWTACTVLAAWYLHERGTLGLAFLAGVPVGLACATKYSGATLAIPVAWAVLERTWRDRAVGRFLLLGVTSAIGMLIAFAATCPACAFRPTLLQDAITYHHFNTMVASFANNHLTPSLGWAGLPYVYQLVASLPWSLGWPLWLLASAGIVVAIVRHDAGDRLLLTAIIPYAAVVGASAVTFPRYLIPLLPMLAVLAARAGVGRVGRGRGGLVLISAIVLYTSLLTASHMERFSWRQQSEVAAWLQSRLPRGALVTMPEFADYFRLRTPLTDAGLRPENRPDGRWRDGNPDAIVVAEWYAIALGRDRPGGVGVTELAALESGTSGWTLAERWPIPPYFTQALYTAIDPALAVDLWSGAIGFRVYLPDGRTEARPQ